jgi:hypothetical protein
MMEAVLISEKSVLYETTRRHIPEGCIVRTCSVTEGGLHPSAKTGRDVRRVKVNRPRFEPDSYHPNRNQSLGSQVIYCSVYSAAVIRRLKICTVKGKAVPQHTCVAQGGEEV